MSTCPTTVRNMLAEESKYTNVFLAAHSFEPNQAPGPLFHLRSDWKQSFEPQGLNVSKWKCGMISCEMSCEGYGNWFALLLDVRSFRLEHPTQLTALFSVVTRMRSVKLRIGVPVKLVTFSEKYCFLSRTVLPTRLSITKSNCSTSL